MKIKLKRLRQLVREELLREYPAGIGLVSPVDPDGAYDYDYDIFDHGQLVPGETIDYHTFRSDDPKKQLGMTWDEKDPCAVHPAALGLVGVASRGDNAQPRGADNLSTNPEGDLETSTQDELVSS